MRAHFGQPAQQHQGQQQLLFQLQQQLLVLQQQVLQPQQQVPQVPQQLQVPQVPLQVPQVPQQMVAQLLEPQQEHEQQQPHLLYFTSLNTPAVPFSVFDCSTQQEAAGPSQSSPASPALAERVAHLTDAINLLTATVHSLSMAFDLDTSALDEIIKRFAESVEALSRLS
ncbi:uncharacterized protein LOC127750917 [Frankliniella occidentalis]|uniref:Uncharacterized protein LOC127750917 n=1 Tax=Frankliniella occidentalis TaxID=133901 RepID=A0A9C6X5J4_FRAOC|nr:uncharacterized protein LOC127750917 [Frankliniella occidentalis]